MPAETESQHRTCVWAKDLPDDEFERVRKSLTERRYPKGGYICHRGDQLDYWTGVASGLIKMSAVSVDGKAMTFAGIGKGAWFGEGSLLKDEPRKYDLVALRDTTLVLMSKQAFRWLSDNSAAFNRFLVRQLNERMGLFIATIEQDRILDPKARVARNIAWLCNPVLYPEIGRKIEISQEELALLAGLSRAVVNKALQALGDEGLIRCEHGLILVGDVEKLGDYGA